MTDADLDLDAYLERIGVDDRGLEPTQATLARLHRAHVLAVPFANVDLLLGSEVRLDLETLQDKLVVRRRGGYCYEHATLFAAVLRRLGFGTVSLLARVGPEDGPERPRSHMVLRVTTEDAGDWIADVGFGLAMLEPLELRDGAQERMGVWEHRLRHLDDGRWLLQTHDGARWTTDHAFDLVEQLGVDVVAANHFTATWPSSPFVGQLVAMRNEPERRFRLVGRTLERLRPGEAASETLGGAGVVAALEEIFHFPLDAADQAALARLL